MVLKKDIRAVDQWSWYCNEKNCKKSISLRSNTWFANSKLKLEQILKLAYGWFRKHTQLDAADEAGLGNYTEKNGNKTVIDW